MCARKRSLSKELLSYFLFLASSFSSFGIGGKKGPCLEGRKQHMAGRMKKEVARTKRERAQSPYEKEIESEEEAIARTDRGPVK